MSFATTQDTPATAPAGDFVLVLTCPDRPGIVHAVSGFLVAHGGNIIESQQFGDQLTQRFFMRLDFLVPGTDVTAETLRTEFAEVASEFGMTFELWDARAPYRTLIMVSKHLHCLNDLLFRYSTGSLQIEIPAVVSNHLDAEPLARAHGLDFVHIPVTPETKPQAEDQLRELVEKHAIHLVVLARYMQVLSDELCTELSGRAINIHHSFLPSFKGAKALPPGLRPGREAGRRHRPLRHRRPRRGTDHRAGRRPRGPRLQPGAAGDRRSRRRGAGPLPRGPLALGVPGPAQRTSHGGLPLRARCALLLRDEQRRRG